MTLSKKQLIVIMVMMLLILVSTIAKNERFNNLESKIEVLESQNSNLRQMVKREDLK